MSDLVQIGNIAIDINELKSSLWNIVSLEENKCLINFKGKTDITTGQVMNRAPLILECPIQVIMDLIEKAAPVETENIMAVTKKLHGGI